MSAYGFPELACNPFDIFVNWYTAAQTLAIDNPNAMHLSTVDIDGAPHGRIVLCKAIDTELRILRFFTNYHSEKSKQLQNNPTCALTFYWDAAGRQVRLWGTARQSQSAVSDAYFASRHLHSKIGAWASEQSKPYDSPTVLEQRVREVSDRFGIDTQVFDQASTQINDQANQQKIPRPEHWGGWDIHIDIIELWAHGEGRLHQRARWKYQGGQWQPGRWLYP